MNAILHFLRKEFLQLRRDKQLMRIVFIAPIMQLFVFGFAINLDVNEVTMVVVDLDRTAESRAFVDRFTQSGYFRAIEYVSDPARIDGALDQGEATLALTIPRGFGTQLHRGESVSVQALVDGTESNVASVGLNYASLVVAGYSEQILLERSPRGGSAMPASKIGQETRVWYNPALKSRNYLVPGILGMLLMTATGMLTALAIVKEKEAGTMEQLIVTPIKPYQIIIGKLTPFLIVGAIDLVIALAGVIIVFDIPVRGSLVLFFGMSLLFVASMLGIGLFVSTISRTQQQAMMTAMFFVMMPMNFLSGFIFPIENMPEVIQAFTYLLPLRYYFEVIRGLFLRGSGIEVLWPQAVGLAIFATLVLSASALRFRKTLA